MICFRESSSRGSKREICGKAHVVRAEVMLLKVSYMPDTVVNICDLIVVVGDEIEDVVGNGMTHFIQLGHRESLSMPKKKKRDHRIYPLRKTAR